MEIMTSILIGALVGGLAFVVLRSGQVDHWATVAVGILGALLGLATHTGLGDGGLIDFVGCEYVASGTGAVLALLLWCVAQRLFLARPAPKVHD